MKIVYRTIPPPTILLKFVKPGDVFEFVGDREGARPLNMRTAGGYVDLETAVHLIGRFQEQVRIYPEAVVMVVRR